MDSYSIMWSLFIGSIGLGYFLYGKKSQNFVWLISGLVMMAYPLFVPGIFLSLLIGAVLMLLPFFLK